MTRVGQTRSDIYIMQSAVSSSFNAHNHQSCCNSPSLYDRTPKKWV